MFILAFLLELIIIALLQLLVFDVIIKIAPIDYEGFGGIVEWLFIDICLTVIAAIIYTVYFYAKHSKNQPTIMERYIYTLLKKERHQFVMPLGLHVFIRFVISLVFLAIAAIILVGLI